MKLRMSILKGRIQSRSLDLVKFMNKELEEICFSISVDMDYKLILKRAYETRYSISVIDGITKENRDFGFGEYLPSTGIKDSEVFLKIEHDLLSLFGGLMFDQFVSVQQERTKGRKRLLAIIVEHNPGFPEESAKALLEKKPQGLESTVLNNALKICKTKFIHGLFMDYVDFQI
ncbi:hypothetical protein CF8_0017 [Aeromonas phage CF8]|nr:hypothetical protein CF8_0017 [Aeromonas phage CF8]